MRKGLLASGLALLTTSSLCLAQPPGISPLEGSPSRPLVPASGVLEPLPGDITSPEACGNGSRGPGCCVEPCGPPGRVWASAEYLLWWIKDSHVPPLVTGGTPASLGVLGSPGTTVLFGGSELDHESFSGGRFSVGFWLNDCHTIGAETDFFFLAPRSARFTAGGSGAPGSAVLARPFFDVLTGAESSELISFPGILAGNIQVSARSRLWGAEENLLLNLCCCGSCCSGRRVDLIAGFRYLDLDENLTIDENLMVNPTVPTIGGSTLAVSDEFGTHNRFYGGQIGARAEWWRGKAFANLTTKVALGDNHEVVNINGTTVITAPGGARTVAAGGLLALPSNSGHFERDRFAVVPEVGVNVGYQATNHLRVFLGYTFLYWSDVVRPGDQIDRVINVSQLPSNAGPGTLVGPARPAFSFKETDFWAQGLNLGVEFRF